jgi:hypothetical protein
MGNKLSSPLAQARRTTSHWLAVGWPFAAAPAVELASC